VHVDADLRGALHPRTVVGETAKQHALVTQQRHRIPDHLVDAIGLALEIRDRHRNPAPHIVERRLPPAGACDLQRPPIRANSSRFADAKRPSPRRKEASPLGANLEE
jgi:hypothetical protein